MPRDMGIDAWNIEGNRVAQMKLYQGSIPWRHFSTFLSCCDVFENPEKILYRTKQSSVCDMIQFRIDRKMITDITVTDSTFRDECKKIQKLTFTSHTLPEETILRPYQIESIAVLEKGKDTKKNVYLCIPTGGGKTMIILHNHINNISQLLLVLVPRIVLMEQWGEECVKLGIKPYLIGTGQHHNMEKIKDETIVICVYDSFPNIYEHKDKFQRYCIDEAHNIKIPERYMDTQIDNDIEIDDDTDEEQLSYMECIQSLSDSKQAIYISATLDKPKDGSLFYEYKLRQAINEGYLCDYQFVFPIFEQENVSNDHLAHYLVHKEHASHCVIYASSCKEGKEFTQILNKLQKGCAGYIDAHTPYKKRKQLFADFESGKIHFLINIRVLTEGFNAPHIRSIFFLRISTSDIFTIQVVGRALRLHQDKSIATIYFPFTQESDLERIQAFLHQLSTYDERINQTISEKKIGGYISIEHGDMKDNDAEEDENIEDVFTFKYNLIVNSMGRCDKIEEMMKKTADELMKFVNDKGRIPTQKEEFGKFWHNTKNRKGRYLEIYQTILSKNSILSADYEKTQKIKEDKKDKLSFEDQAKMLFNTTHVPKQNEVIYVRGYPFQIGRYWTRILQGQSHYLYKTIISQNPILSVAYEEAKRRRVISTKDKANEVIKFVNVEKRVPKYNEVIYVKGFKFKIGKFWVSIKYGQNHVIYKTILSKNLILSADYDKTQKKKIEPKYDILDYSKMNLKELKQLCKDRQITGYSRKNKEELNNILSADYDKVQKIKDEQIEPEQINYYSTMNILNLRKLCKDTGITGYSQKKRVELIRMLSNQHKLADK
jgi:superfamily II DNA or RNA helicase